MSVKSITRLLAMVRVTDVKDEEAPTVLLVDNNQMSLHRLTNIFRQREFNVVTCEDGDKAVDEYIRIDPELVVLALDIPSMDGHLAALEMREHGKDCRILFSAPNAKHNLQTMQHTLPVQLGGLKNQSQLLQLTRYGI